jgi:hypothetical protein
MTTRSPQFATRYSSHGYGIDVRKTYRSLPAQPFWTWVTGKSLNSASPREPKETLLMVWQMLLHISWAYAVLIGGVLTGNAILNSDWSLPTKILVSIPLMVLITNRQRGMLHTFHYTIHGAGVQSRPLSRFLCKWVLSIPILHTSWEKYMLIHIRDHHGRRTFCTENDPDQQFMTKHGFYKGMSEHRFWFLVAFAPLHPMRIVEHLQFRFEQNFIAATRSERAARLLYWICLVSFVVQVGLEDAFAIYYLIPILFITQHSSWLQHITEHLWFADKDPCMTPDVHYASLSWGRFLGRPFPCNETGWGRITKLTGWVVGTALIDIPLRIYSFMQDMPSHDFHHRDPKVNFWHIAPERAANEGLPSKFGPMTETWGVLESLLVQRDHLCRGISDPFGLIAWEREYHEILQEMFKKKSHSVVPHKEIINESDN